MNLSKIKKVLNKLLNFIPTALPRGLTEFNTYAQSIIDTYNPPMDPRSVKFVIATLMLRLNPTEAYKPKRFFALALHKGACAEVASYVMGQLKQEQAEEQEAARKQELEATANRLAEQASNVTTDKV
jgi:hypothetical protein